MDRLRRQDGFSLLEMLTVMTIMAILFAIAAVSIKEYRERTGIRESARSVEGLLYHARATARSRQRPVVVLFTEGTCTAFIDTNDDGLYKPPGSLANPADEDIFLNEYVADGVELSGEAPFVIPGSISFTAMGSLNTTVSRAVLMRMVTYPTRLYRVTVFITGSTRVEKSEESGADGSWFKAW